jgi:hypothetical protein
MEALEVSAVEVLQALLQPALARRDRQEVTTDPHPHGGHCNEQPGQIAHGLRSLGGDRDGAFRAWAVRKVTLELEPGDLIGEGPQPDPHRQQPGKQ